MKPLPRLGGGRHPLIKPLPRGYVRSYETPEFGVTPAVYVGGCALLHWNLSPRTGMTVDLRMRDPDGGLHPFKGMSCGRQHGQRFRIVVSLPAEDGSADSAQAVYVGEAMLMRWADDNLNGMMVRFLIDGGPDGAQGRHPFDGLAPGRRDGEPLVLVAWAVADDDTPLDRDKVKKRTPFHEMPAVKQTHVMCKDQRFQRWLADEIAELLPGAEGLPPFADDPKSFAEAVVRAWIGVESRKVMSESGTASGERARSRWRSLLSRYEAASWETGADR